MALYGAEAMVITDIASVIGVMSSGAPKGSLPGMPGLQPVLGVSQDEE